MHHHMILMLKIDGKWRLGDRLYTAGEAAEWYNGPERVAFEKEQGEGSFRILNSGLADDD